MSDPKRLLTGIQPKLSDTRMMSPATYTNAPPVAIPMVQNPYGSISIQPQQYLPHLTYTQLPNVQNRMPLVGAIPPTMPGIYLPVSQGPRAQMLASPMSGVHIPAAIVSQNIDPVKLLEQKKMFEKERNFQLQQERLKQFTVTGKKGNINADNLIGSMFGKSQPKEGPKSRSSSVSKPIDTNEIKKPFISLPAQTSVLPSLIAVPPSSSEQFVKPSNDAVYVQAQKKKELDAMMLECSDLKGPQKANKFSKPVVKELIPSAQLRSTFTSSNKARDWKDVQGLDEVFVEKRPRFPGWCTKEKVSDVYRKVEVIVTENSTHDPETSLLFPILVSSGLPQQSLAHIWELVNQSAPGHLTINEMYAALALIAVSQAGHEVKSAEVLHQLPSCPVPQLQYFMNQSVTQNLVEEPAQSTMNVTGLFSNSSAKEENDSSTTHQIIRPTAISLSSDGGSILNASNSTENYSSLPSISTSGFISSPDDEFDDFKSATPTCVNFFLPQTTTSASTKEEDEFDDFKQAPIVNVNSVANKVVTVPTTTKSTEEQDLMSPDEDKYSVFRLLQQTDDPNDWGDFTSPSSETNSKSNAKIVEEKFDYNNSKTEPSFFELQSTEKTVADPIIEIKNDDDFGDFLHAEVKQTPFVSVTTQFQNLDTNFADFAKFEENPLPVPTLSVSENSQADDEFGEFASSLSVSTKTELGHEFLFHHLKDNTSLAESQSVSSLELGTYDGGGHSGESKSSLSRQGSIPSLDLKSNCPESTEAEDCISESAFSSTLSRTLKSPSPSKHVKDIEYNNSSVGSQGINFQTVKTIPLTDKYSVIRSEERIEDQHISSWTQCLQNAVNILQNTRKIFNQMSCSSICNEVLSTEEGGNYIKDVIEVYKVVRRLALSSKSFSKQTVIIQDLLKEADQAWNTICGFFAGSPLMPQDSSFDFSTAMLKSDGDDNVKACGLCLLNVEIKSFKNGEGNLILCYGGRNYHGTCANFWVNCVDPLLPALTLPQLL